jgi:hypothetical protein
MSHIAPFVGLITVLHDSLHLAIANDLLVFIFQSNDFHQVYSTRTCRYTKWHAFTFGPDDHSYVRQGQQQAISALF